MTEARRSPGGTVESHLREVRLQDTMLQMMCEPIRLWTRSTTSARMKVIPACFENPPGGRPPSTSGFPRKQVVEAYIRRRARLAACMWSDPRRCWRWTATTRTVGAVWNYQRISSTALRPTLDRLAAGHHPHHRQPLPREPRRGRVASSVREQWLGSRVRRHTETPAFQAQGTPTAWRTLRRRDMGSLFDGQDTNE